LQASPAAAQARTPCWCPGHPVSTPLYTPAPQGATERWVVRFPWGSFPSREGGDNRFWVFFSMRLGNVWINTVPKIIGLQTVKGENSWGHQCIFIICGQIRVTWPTVQDHMSHNQHT
jgi:hypothetical protein